ncbi:MAG: hypothetical protein ACFFG0_04085 [Candidatus Thorarchaeota archaeon]
MKQLLEWGLIIFLVSGLSFMVFDVKPKTILSMVGGIITLIIIGIFLGLGIKLSSLIF